MQQVTRDALSRCRKRTTVSEEPPAEKTYRDFLPENFEFAVADQISPVLRQNLKEAMANGPWPILIHGRPGNGKSSAAAIALASQALKDLRAAQVFGRSEVCSVFWWTWETLVADLLTARKRRDRSFPVRLRGMGEFYRRESFVMERLSNPRYLVVLDDFAVTRLADWDVKLMFELIDRLKSGRVILTSNNSIESMIEKDIIDERVASRLQAGTIIAATGDDRRSGKRVIA